MSPHVSLLELFVVGLDRVCGAAAWLGEEDEGWAAGSTASGSCGAVSGGMNVLLLPLAAFSCRSQEGGGQGGQNDPAQMFQQIMQQLTQGG